MKPLTKPFTMILAYCIVLWLTNWSLSHEYSREAGLTSSSLDARGAGALLGLIATVILARRIWRVTRNLLDTRVRIPKSIRLWGAWSYLWLLLPLAFGFKHHSFGVAEDGATVETVLEFGGGSSWLSILFSAIAIMLFQLLLRLVAFSSDNHIPESGRSMD